MTAMRVGDTVGRFRLERALGQGPTSEVFLAIEPTLCWKVAVKVFVPEPVSFAYDHARWSQRMVREATTASSFRHPNAVVVHEVGQWQGSPYLARDFIEGKALAEYVADLSPAARGWKLHWLLELAEVLAAIHASGLVHRNVKPSGAVIRRDGQLKLLDFGIARRSVDRAAGIAIPSMMPGPAESSGQYRPLPAHSVGADGAYMSPEQLGHLRVDPRTDQFGWAVTAFELLSGRLPWGPGLAPVPLIEAVLTAPAPRLSTRTAGIAPALDDLVARCLAKDPSERWPTMDAVVLELRRISGS